MQTEEILQFLSDNHRVLILAGGLVSFISVFLPFILIDSMHVDTFTLSGYDVSLSTTWLFWIYIIVIGGMYYGYFQGYGEQYPNLFLIIGGFLVLMTLYGTQIFPGRGTGITPLYGFFLELIGSAAVAVGGYYYDQSKKNQVP